MQIKFPTSPTIHPLLKAHMILATIVCAMCAFYSWHINPEYWGMSLRSVFNWVYGSLATFVTLFYFLEKGLHNV